MGVDWLTAVETGLQSGKESYRNVRAKQEAKKQEADKYKILTLSEKARAAQERRNAVLSQLQALRDENQAAFDNEVKKRYLENQESMGSLAWQKFYSDLEGGGKKGSGGGAKPPNYSQWEVRARADFLNNVNTIFPPDVTDEARKIIAKYSDNPAAADMELDVLLRSSKVNREDSYAPGQADAERQRALNALDSYIGGLEQYPEGLRMPEPRMQPTPPTPTSQGAASGMRAVGQGVVAQPQSYAQPQSQPSAPAQTMPKGTVNDPIFQAYSVANDIKRNPTQKPAIVAKWTNELQGAGFSNEQIFEIMRAADSMK